MILQFILILGILAIIDYLYLKIPNLIILPAIAYGIYKTGNWQAALIMFLIMAIFLSEEAPITFHKKYFWPGGDVKLMVLIGAFLGTKAIFILPLTLCLIYLYRITKKVTEVLPITPFAFLAALPFIFMP